jgi:hypothetical protein
VEKSGYTAPSEAPRAPYPWRIVLGVLVAVAVVAFVVMFKLPAPTIPPASSSKIDVTPTPNVVLAVRELSRLETSSYHMERVVELSDQQSKLWGLITTKDAILLVAVGDVTAGIDLQKVTDADITLDWAERKVTLKLPAPEVFSSSLDNTKTHVYSRNTDRFATRREDLEGLARSEAENSMKKAAVDGGILDRAKSNGERALRSLLQSLGFKSITLEWK